MLCSRRRRYLLYSGIGTFLCMYIITRLASQNTYDNDVLGGEDVVNYMEFEIVNQEQPKEELTKLNSSSLQAQRKDDKDGEIVDSVTHKVVSLESDTIPLQMGSDNCSASIYSKQTAIKTPYKIYIYNLPSKFNRDLLQCVRLMGVGQCGFGPTLFAENDDVVFTNTWQFSLDMIIHHKLMFSPYRTLDPTEADVFLIPFYEASNCFCNDEGNSAYYPTAALENALLGEIQRFSYYRAGKPHVMTVGKIEKEERSKRCPLLLHPWTWNVTLIGIEAHDHLRQSKPPNDRTYPPFIAVPYPSYVHFIKQDGGLYYKNIFSHHRRVFIFMAASQRKSIPFRLPIFEQLPNRTSVSIEEYYAMNRFPASMELDTMWLVTPGHEGPHVEATVRWMREAVFCLQPPGDSPTRKSIYDGILCGCIPVFFEDPHGPVRVTFPFQDVFDYSGFSVTIPRNATTRFAQVLEPYRHEAAGKLRVLQKNLHSIMPFMQYSFAPDNQPHTDAMKMILDQLGKLLNL